METIEQVLKWIWDNTESLAAAYRAGDKAAIDVLECYQLYDRCPDGMTESFLMDAIEKFKTVQR